MKAILSIFLLSLVLVSCSDIEKLMGGFLDQSGIDETNRKEILPCANSVIWEMVQSVIPKFRLTLQDDPNKLQDAMSIFMRIPFESILLMRSCDVGKTLKVWDEKCQKTSENMHTVNDRVKVHKDKLMALSRNLLTEWDEYNYYESGKILAKISFLILTPLS